MIVRRLMLLGILLLGGCHAHPQSQAAIDIGDGLILQVANNNWSDVVIYTLRDGTRTRFVVATAATSTTVPFPLRFVNSSGTIQLVAHRIGGTDEYVSPVVSVRMGHTIALTLESNLVRSTVGVW